MRQANPDFMNGLGAEPTAATGTNGTGGSLPSAIDLRNVSFGGQTFSNPCFWILLGVVGTIAIQYLMTHQRKHA